MSAHLAMEAVITPAQTLLVVLDALADLVSGFIVIRSPVQV